MRRKQNLFLAQKKKLQEAGCEDFNESIKLMYAKAYNVPLVHVYKSQNNEDLDEKDRLFLNMVNRRAAGEPVSHIIKSRSFWKNEFYIEETVLDPRPESELIIEITKDSLFNGMKVLDLGCGSGCIGLSLYHENPEVRLFLSDTSGKALNVAKKNADNLGFTCEFFQSNLFEEIKGKFDLELDYKKGLKVYERNLQNLIYIFQKNNINIILSSYCFYLHEDVKNSKLNKIYQKIVTEENRVIEELAQKNNIKFVDCDSKIPKNIEYFLDTVHLTPKGMQFVANEISKAVDLN